MERSAHEQERLDRFYTDVSDANSAIGFLRICGRQLYRKLSEVGDNRDDKLKLALHFCKEFAFLSKDARECRNKVANVLRHAGKLQCLDSAYHFKTYRSRGEELSNHRLNCGSLKFEFDPEEFTKQCNAASTCKDEFLSVANTLDYLYERAVTLAKECIDAYNRKHAVYGGREAISILKVWVDKFDATGGEETSKMQAMFGWGGVSVRRWFSIRQRIEEVIRMVRLGAAKNYRPGRGQAPSYKAGYALLSEPVTLSDAQKHRVLVQKYVTKYRLFSSPVGVTKTAASHVIRAMKIAKNNRRALATARWIEKHFVASMNGVPTIITGEPQRCEGNDYKVPCTFLYGGVWHDGFVLLRRGWRGAFHAIDDLQDRQVSRQLDLSASNDWRSAGDIKQLVKQRAATLRACRSREQVRIKDSYAVGNCQPGTAAFCETLGITTDVIDGRELAKRWRAAKYPELNLFSKIFRQSPVAV